MAEAWKIRLSRLGILGIASGGFTGYFPFASGTVGSALAVALAWGIRGVPLPVYLSLVLGLFALGVWASDRAGKLYGVVDSSRIVIDEIVGMLITLAGAPQTPYWFFCGFVLFRFLDVVKIPPSDYFDARVANGWGVMMDDVVAGIYANIWLQLMQRASL